MKQKIIVIDDFYDQPNEIRRFALSLPFHKKKGATYPGVEAIVDWDFSEVRQEMADFIHEDISGSCPKPMPFAQGKFRLALADDEETRVDNVHIDIQPWSGVVYLSLPKDCSGHSAVSFYRHRATGEIEDSEIWREYISAELGFNDQLPKEERTRRFWEYMRDKSCWDEIERIENRFNRVLLLYARVFHGSVGIFGSEPSNGRLTQHFEFYYPSS